MQGLGRYVQAAKPGVRMKVPSIMCRRRHRPGAVAAVLVLATAGLTSQPGGMELTFDAPAPLVPVADRVRAFDRQDLARALARAGLRVPPRIHVMLIPEDDPRAHAAPPWVVGLASGSHDISIFPGRIGSSRASYPFDSLESIVWHEAVHLAISAQAAGQPVPRWFHEGVAMSVEKGWSVTSQTRLLLATARSPGLPDLGRLFASDSQRESATAYLLAAALVSDIRERHGAATPGAIVERVGRGVSFAHAFALETGETPDQAAAHAWQVYGRWTNWVPVLTHSSSVWLGIMLLAALAFLVTLRRRRRRRREWDEDETSAPGLSDPPVHSRAPRVSKAE
jgi:LPXTG-motif cell wall-anchored protein